MKTILLTGGTGFLGKHILRSLIDEGYSVVLLLRESSDVSKIDDIKDKLSVVYFRDLEELFKSGKIYGVIHCATFYKKTHEREDIENMIYVNMTIPVTILDLCSRYNVRKFINTGTFFEYDLDTFEFSENNSDSAYNLYASTKLSFINTIEFYVKNFPLSVITLRLFSPYGPGEDKKIISLIIDALILNKELSLQDISPELHFTFVSDIARAFILTLKYMDGTDSFGHKIINIGSRESTSINDVITTLEKISGKELSFKVLTPFIQKRKSFCNTNKALDLLQWKTLVNLEEGLRLTLTAFQNEIQ